MSDGSKSKAGSQGQTTRKYKDQRVRVSPYEKNMAASLRREAQQKINGSGFAQIRYDEARVSHARQNGGMRAAFRAIERNNRSGNSASYENRVILRRQFRMTMLRRAAQAERDGQRGFAKALRQEARKLTI